MPSGPILEVECREPDGAHQRQVWFCRLTSDKLRYFYDRLSRYDTLWLGTHDRSFEGVLKNFIVQRADGEIEPTGIIWQVDDVGILSIDEIRPGYQCYFHYAFWDQRLRGRVPLIREMLQYIFKTYDFHRIATEIPMYAHRTLFRVEEMGFKREGRKRSVVQYRGEWWDTILFAIIEGELDEAKSDNGTADITGDTVRDGLLRDAAG